MAKPTRSEARPVLAVLAIGILTILGPGLAGAQDEREPGWYDQAELSLVQTGGNTEASTLGFKNLLERQWEEALFTFATGALRSESTTFTRTAIGTPDDFALIENEDTELTAENFYARTRYDHDIREDFFWFAGAGWQRNEFAGFTNRYTAVGGLGNSWWDNDQGHYLSDYGVTFTDQEDVVDNPATSDSFLGLQVTSDYLRNFGERASYQNVLVVNANLDETEDLRADMTNSVQVSMTERLALKVSLQLEFDNQPALAAVPLFDASGAPTGQTVRAELDELDTQLTIALVVDF